jgi:hypothetical protein
MRETIESVTFHFFLFSLDHRSQPYDLKAIRILYPSMLVGLVLFAIIVTVMVETGMLSNSMHSMTPVSRSL